MQGPFIPQFFVLIPCNLLAPQGYYGGGQQAPLQQPYAAPAQSAFGVDERSQAPRDQGFDSLSAALSRGPTPVAFNRAAAAYSSGTGGAFGDLNPSLDQGASSGSQYAGRGTPPGSQYFSRGAASAAAPSAVRPGLDLDNLFSSGDRTIGSASSGGLFAPKKAPARRGSYLERQSMDQTDPEIPEEDLQLLLGGFRSTVDLGPPSPRMQPRMQQPLGRRSPVVTPTANAAAREERRSASGSFLQSRNEALGNIWSSADSNIRAVDSRAPGRRGGSMDVRHPTGGGGGGGGGAWEDGIVRASRARRALDFSEVQGDDDERLAPLTAQGDARDAQCASPGVCLGFKNPVSSSRRMCG